MSGEKDLSVLLKGLEPKHIAGDYVFCTLAETGLLQFEDIIMYFREEEGQTFIIRKELADKLGLAYNYVAAWITITIHSSLEAVGLTAAFATALSKEGISCNVVAAYYHDHIFVQRHDVDKAMEVLRKLSGR